MNLHFSDIPKVQYADYCTNVSWTRLNSTLKSYIRCSLDLTPKFRQVNTWTPANQTRYIENCLQGDNQSNSIRFNHTGGFASGNPGDFVLVDGFERLRAVRLFFNNEVRAFGRLYDDYRGKPSAFFFFWINNLKTDDEIFEWYRQLNYQRILLPNLTKKLKFSKPKFVVIPSRNPLP